MDVIYIDVLGNAWISTGRHVGISMDIQGFHGCMESMDFHPWMQIADRLKKGTPKVPRI